MKTFLKWSMLLPLIGLMSTSCGGPDPTPIDDKDLILSVDKSEIFTTNDEATFTVKYGDEDVTAKAKIINTETTEALPDGTYKFSSVTTGEYEFQASYDEKTSNVVSVTVNKRPSNIVELTTDKTTIAPDGEDFVTLTVFFNDEDVSADARVKNTATGEYLEVEDNVYKVAAPENDFDFSASFVAEYNDKTSETVNIKSLKFFQSVALHKFTATWCGPCKTFTIGLNSYLQQNPGAITEVAIHCGSGDSFANTVSNSLAEKYEVNSVPAAFWSLQAGNVGSVGYITSIVNSTLSDYPASTILRSRSTMLGDNVTLDIDVWSLKEDTYKLGVILIENNLKDITYGIFNHVFRKFISVDEFGDDLGTIGKNQKTTKTYTLTGMAMYPQERTRFVIYTTHIVDGEERVDNIFEVPMVGNSGWNLK